jgi:hypothetical protein
MKKAKKKRKAKKRLGEYLLGYLALTWILRHEYMSATITFLPTAIKSSIYLFHPLPRTTQRRIRFRIRISSRMYLGLAKASLEHGWKKPGLKKQPSGFFFFVFVFLYILPRRESFKVFFSFKKKLKNLKKPIKPKNPFFVGFFRWVFLGGFFWVSFLLPTLPWLPPAACWSPGAGRSCSCPCCPRWRPVVPSPHPPAPYHQSQVAVVRIRMFLGLLDPDPLVRVMDPDPSVVKQKKSKKNHDSYCLVTSF